jgi:hypothetical protein
VLSKCYLKVNFDSIAMMRYLAVRVAKAKDCAFYPVCAAAPDYLIKGVAT